MPAVILVAVFSYYPFIKAFISSFFIENQLGEITEFVGLENYKALFSNDFFIQSVKTTFLLAAIFVPVNTILTLAAASFVRRETRYNELIGALYIIPLAFSMSLLALIFKQIFNPVNSIINKIFNLDIVWLNDRTSAIIAIVVLCVFLDFALVELPLIVPTLIMTIFIALKDVLLISAPIMLMTEGGPFRSTESVMFYYYIEAFRGHNKAAESTISSITVIFSSLLLIVYSLIQKRRRHA